VAGHVASAFVQFFELFILIIEYIYFKLAVLVYEKKGEQATRFYYENKVVFYPAISIFFYPFSIMRKHNKVDGKVYMCLCQTGDI
jgi:hypothetical protein